MLQNNKAASLYHVKCTLVQIILHYVLTVNALQNGQCSDCRPICTYLLVIMSIILYFQCNVKGLSWTKQKKAKTKKMGPPHFYLWDVPGIAA